jgi:uncharacterized GH25 family protein
MHRVRHLVAGLSAVVLAAWSAATVAHEFWIEPSDLFPRLDQRVGFRLCVGDGSDAAAIARDESRIETFTMTGPAGQQTVPGLHGSNPAGIARFTASGDYVIAYETNHAYAQQSATQFDEHLFEVGLETIAASRRRHDEGARPVREAYSRHAKALIKVGAGKAQDRVVGLRLELNLEDPGSPSTATDQTTVRLLYLGRPLAGALVTADALGSYGETLEARSDTQGRVNLSLRHGHTWRIAAVHMVRGDRALGADWESLWASLVFALPDGKARRDGVVRQCTAPTGKSIARSSSISQPIAPPPPPPPLFSPQVVSPETVVPARLSRNTVPLPQRPPLVVVPRNSVVLS